jgi:hypothetical protein
MDELRRRAQPLLDEPPVAPLPIGELHRRASRRRTRRAVASVVVVGAAVALSVALVVSTHTSSSERVAVVPTTLGATTTTTLPLPGVGVPTRFVSLRDDTDAHEYLEISDARTGVVVKTLWRVPGDGSYVTGTAVGPNGRIWVTLNRGPKRRDPQADGGVPLPHTCSSLLVQIDPRTGTVQTLLYGGDNELIEEIDPSPTGDRIAYSHSGCLPDSASSLQVKELATGRVETIDTAAAKCPRYGGGPRWSLNGDALVFRCSGTHSAQISIVPVGASASEVRATTAPETPTCDIDSFTVTRDGYAAIENCGNGYVMPGSGRLVRYDPSLQFVSRQVIGQCVNGDSIGGDAHSQAVLISAYMFCSATAKEPFTRLFTDTGQGLRHPALVSIAGGYPTIAEIAFLP